MPNTTKILLGSSVVFIIIINIIGLMLSLGAKTDTKAEIPTVQIELSRDGFVEFLEVPANQVIHVIGDTSTYIQIINGQSTVTLPQEVGAETAARR